MRYAVIGLMAPALLAQTIALTGVTVIDPRSGAATPHRTIVIRGERITSISPPGRMPAGTRRIPAAGKFVIPGLWDMHVHVGEIEQDWFSLYLARGITGLREMAASERNAPLQRRYAQEVAQGRRIGPELFWTLFPMDAPGIQDSAQARAEVARRAALGLRFIKVYNGLSRESYFAIADECRKRGLQMVGHVPTRVSAREAAQAGQASIEHLDGLLLACSSKEAEARWLAQQNRYPWRMLVDTFDSSKAEALMEAFRTAGTWQTPTLVIHRIASLARDRKLPGDLPIEYARRDYARSWPREALDFPDATVDAGTARRLLHLYQELVRLMDRKGVRILAGTDTPFAYCVPGFALHDELALLVESGLSPIAALRTATSNPADFLHVSSDYGSIEPGKIADLVVLDANPLESIANTRRIWAVVRRGHWIDSASLRSMLESARPSTGTK